MTISSNIFVGIAAWTPNTSFSVLGTRVSNGGSAYQLIGVGTSAASGGPTGVGASITDNTCAWKFVAVVNFTSFASWTASIPASLTQPMIGVVYKTSTLTTVAGTSYLTLSGHTTSAVNTITLVAAPGDSFRDTLVTQTIPLAFNTANGVSFVLPSGVGGVNYLNISDSNVIIDGFQFQDPFSTSNCSVIGGTGSNVTIRNCILDGFSQPNAADIIQFGGTGHIYNTLIVDRQGSAVLSPAIFVGATPNSLGSTVTNCTIIGINNPTTAAIISDSTSTVTIRNTAIFGYSTVGNFASQSFDHCCISASTVAPGTNGGSNLVSKLVANQFVSPTTDFRLLGTADCINAGVTDTIDIPSADDIIRTPRPQSIAWDISAWEFKTPYAITAAISFNKLSSISSVSQNITTPLALATDPAIAGSNPFSTVFSTAFGAGTFSLIAADPLPSIAVLNVTATDQGIDTVILNWAAPNPGPIIVIYADGFSNSSFIGNPTLPPLRAAGTIFQLGALVARATIPGITANGVVASANPVSSRVNLEIVTAGASGTSSQTFAETNFTGVTGVIGVPVGTTSITLNWQPTAESFNFNVIRASSQLIFANGAQSKSFIMALQPGIQAGQSDGITASSSFFSLSCTASSAFTVTVGLTETGIIVPLTTVATAVFSTPVSATNTIELLSSNTVASTFGAASAVNINLTATAVAVTYAVSAANNFNIKCVATILGTSSFLGRNSINITASVVLTEKNGLSAANNINFASVANVANNWFFTAESNIVIQFFGGIGQSNNASLSAKTIEALSTSGHLLLTNGANGTNTIEALTAIGVTANSCSALLSIENLTALVSMGSLGYSITVRDTFLSLSINNPVSKFIESEDHLIIQADVPSFAKAPGVPLSLLEDSTFVNMTQTDAASGSATISIYTVHANIKFGSSATLTKNIDFSATSVVSQATLSNGSGTLTLSCLSAIGIGASAIISIFPLVCGPTINDFIAADLFNLLLKTDGPVSLFIEVDAPNRTQVTQQDLANGSTSINISAAITALVSHVATAINSILFSPSVQAVQQDFASALATLSTTFTGVSNLTRTATAIANIDITASVISFSTFRANLTANINITPSITTIQSYAASATSTISITSAAMGGVGLVASATNQAMVLSTTQAIATQLQAAVGVGTLLPITASAAVQQFDLMTAVATPLPITISITATQQNLASGIEGEMAIASVASCVLSTPTMVADTILPLAANAIAVINGSKFSAAISIMGMTASAQAQQFDLAYTTSLNIDITNGGRLWQTPNQYVKGDRVVWWAN